MKKTICIAVALALALSLTACSGSSSSTPASAPAPSEAASVAAVSSEAAPVEAAPTAAYVELAQNLGAEEYGIGFRKGDVALGLEVQRILDQMIADGTAASISTQWFGSDVLFQDKGFLKETEASADDKSLEKVLASKKLIVGLDDSYPPMGYRDEKNEIVGFDIDLAREVASRMVLEVVFQPIDWDSKELELNSGKIDCIWNGMSITPERLENMFFSKPYIANQQIVVVPSGSGITTIEQVIGKKIGLQKGSSSLDALMASPIYEQVKNDVTEYPDNVSVFMDLQAGRVDAFVVDSVVGRYILAQNQ